MAKKNNFFFLIFFKTGIYEIKINNNCVEELIHKKYSASQLLTSFEAYIQVQNPSFLSHGDDKMVWLFRWGGILIDLSRTLKEHEHQ